jgi:hypothetical protein
MQQMHSTSETTFLTDVAHSWTDWPSHSLPFAYQNLLPSWISTPLPLSMLLCVSTISLLVFSVLIVFTEGTPSHVSISNTEHLIGNISGNKPTQHVCTHVKYFSHCRTYVVSLMPRVSSVANLMMPKYIWISTTSLPQGREASCSSQVCGHAWGNLVHMPLTIVNSKALLPSWLVPLLSIHSVGWQECWSLYSVLQPLLYPLQKCLLHTKSCALLMHLPCLPMKPNVASLRLWSTWRITSPNWSLISNHNKFPLQRTLMLKVERNLLSFLFLYPRCQGLPEYQDWITTRV